MKGNKTMKVKIKKLHKDAVIPRQAYPGDAGSDLVSVEDAIIRPGCTVLVSTGIAIELPPQTEAQVRPRSGLAIKNGITVINTPGTIDVLYRGEIKVGLHNTSNEDFKVERGMRIAQMVIQELPEIEMEEVDELSATERGTGGFGSSGLK
jgi:dUTP pyrophosphatase